MEKIERKLGIYCLFDKVTEKYDSFIIGFDDEETKNYFLDETARVAFELAQKGDSTGYNKLFSQLKDSCLLRICTFNDETGAFINDKICLLDYITAESIEGFIRAKFELKNKFQDLVPKENLKKEG